MKDLARPITRLDERASVPPAFSLMSANEPVRAELVHKRRDDGVVLATYRQVADEEFELITECPERFYSPKNGHLDPLFVVEAVREATILVAHVGYAVPTESSFSMQGIAATVLEADWPTTSDSPLNMRLAVRNVQVRAGQLRSMQTQVEFQVDHQIVGRGSGDALVLRPAAYARLRQGQSAREFYSGSTRLLAEEVGRDLQRDVIIGTHGDAWSLVLDTSHPYLFDHPLDHVPGMVLLEGARQAFCNMRPGALIESIRGSFDRYADLEPEITIRATVVAPLRVEFSLLQASSEVARVEIITPATSRRS